MEMGRTPRPGRNTLTGMLRSSWPVRTATFGRRWWACSSRTRLVFTICWATCSSGRRTAGTTATGEPRTTGACGVPATVPFVCCAAAPGTTGPASCARRAAARSGSGAGSSPLDSVSPGRWIDRIMTPTNRSANRCAGRSSSMIPKPPWRCWHGLGVAVLLHHCRLTITTLALTIPAPLAAQSQLDTSSHRFAHAGRG